MADLKGKTVGVFALPSTTMAIAAAVREKQGVTLDPNKDITYQKGPYGTLAGQARSGQLQFAELVEPFVTQLTVTNKFKVLATANDLWKQYTGGFDLLINAWATTEDFAKKHPKALTGIIETYADAVAYIKSNPDSTVRNFLQTKSGITDATVLDVLVPRLIEGMTIVPWDKAAVSREQELLNVFAKYGLLERAITGFLTNEYNP